MSVIFDESSKIFHIRAGFASYAMQIIRDGYLSQLYWGKAISGTSLCSKSEPIWLTSFSPAPYAKDGTFSLDTLPQEYPSYGTSDLRQPAFHAQLADGSTAMELKYKTHRIIKGKPSLPGLPATYIEDISEAETLEIDLADDIAGLKVTLSYTAFTNYNAIARSARIEDIGAQPVKLLKTHSMSLDLPQSQYDLMTLSGSWSRERAIYRRPLAPGLQGIESRRGSSSHMQNPFIALLSKDADEDRGEVYGFSLVYSGNHSAYVEVDQFWTSRITMGINPFDFSWLLNPGESFQTPEVVMVYSSDGIGGMSRTYHDIYRTRLCRGKFRDRVRPILINNWEATYFNFNADKIEAIAQAGKKLGIELFVLDDGWFGRRNDDTTSLGDWFVDKNKLPGGLEDLVSRVNKLGMEFGLWFEPEMVSPESELYKEHPDWCLHIPGRRRTTGRNQLILDLSRIDVQDYIVKAVSDILSCAPITYVKWDMNRNMTEIGSAVLPADRQRETAHRYILGLYSVMDRITSAFPNVLFESCSGGGGRFDPGILYYMPQTWVSDDTDAIERLKIQYGTSIVYPISSMGSHVSAVPNHQVGRKTPLETRGHIAMSGNFGYELDLTKFNEEEKAIVKDQVAIYKEIRGLVQQGELYRLLSPFAGNETSWMFVSKDKTESVVMYVKVLGEPYGPSRRLKLRGLQPDRRYNIVGTEETYWGDELMNVGLCFRSKNGDFKSNLWRLRAVD